jgi:anti-anti-sigma factor
MHDGSVPAPRQFFRVIPADGACIIELSLPDMMDGMQFDQLTDELLAELDVARAPAWVLDMSQVAYIGSALLGLMVNVRQRIKNARGELVLCRMSPRLAEVLAVSSLERLFRVAKTREEALRMV